MTQFVLYVVDCETTGLDPVKNDIIEISFLRLSDNEQKTWWLKPTNPENIEVRALEVNGTNINDILWKTEAGKAKYRLAEEVLPEIENWIADDHHKIYDRVVVGHNVGFDFDMMRQLWIKSDNYDTFPFSKWENSIDTKQLALFFDWVEGKNNEKYNLSACIKKFGLEQRKAHGAIEDVKMTADLLNHLATMVAKKPSA